MTLRELIDQGAEWERRQQEAHAAFVEKTLPLIAAELGSIRERRLSRRPGHPGGGRAARRRGERKRARERAVST